MPQLDLLQAIVNAIEGHGVTYIGQVPQGTDLPYFVVSPVPAQVDYYFGGSLDFTRVQIDQFYRWTGSFATAYADNALIRTALDTLPLGGVMMRQVSTPGFIIEEGRVLHLLQMWEWHEVI